jgi:hypothetical protein
MEVTATTATYLAYQFIFAKLISKDGSKVDGQKVALDESNCESEIDGRY